MTDKKELTFMERVNRVQTELNAPKNQKNNFGKYKYRSLEDINEAVKPYLRKYELVMLLSDELVMIGDRYYIKATASLVDAKGTNERLDVHGYAREALSKKGMDDSQVTGSTSSYARKYAANGLLAIDDSKDADFLNTSEEFTAPPKQKVNSKPKNTRSQAKQIQPQAQEQNSPKVSLEDAKGLQISMTLTKENAEVGKRVMAKHNIEKISDFTIDAMADYYSGIM